MLAVGFSADGQRLLVCRRAALRQAFTEYTVSAGDGGLQAHASPRLRHEFNDDRVRLCAITESKVALAVKTAHGHGHILVVDRRRWSLIDKTHLWRGARDVDLKCCWCLQLSRDGRFLAAAFDDGPHFAHVWDLAAPSAPARLLSTNDTVRCIAFVSEGAPASALLAASCVRDKLHVFRLPTGEGILRDCPLLPDAGFRIQDDSPHRRVLAFSSDAQHLLLASARLLSWRAHCGLGWWRGEARISQLAEVDGGPTAAGAAAISACGSLVALMCRSSEWVHSLELRATADLGTVLCKISGGVPDANNLCFSPDGATLAAWCVNDDGVEYVINYDDDKHFCTVCTWHVGDVLRRARHLACLRAPEEEEDGEEEKYTPRPALRADLRALLHSGAHADVVLREHGGREWRAHQLLLRARSTTFTSLLSDAWMRSAPRAGAADDDLPVASLIPEIDSVTYDPLLRFIYTDEVPDLDPNDIAGTASLLKAASYYRVGRLALVCEAALTHVLTPANAAETLVLADRLSANKLRNAALRVCAVHAQEVQQSHGWALLLRVHPVLAADVVHTMTHGAPPQRAQQAAVRAAAVEAETDAAAAGGGDAPEAEEDDARRTRQRVE